MRMCERVIHKNPILIGVSFGGVLVQEMAKYIDYKKIIIISSVKSNEELPKHMKLAQLTNAHRLLPTQWIKNIETFTLLSLVKEFNAGWKTIKGTFQKGIPNISIGPLTD